MPLVIIFVALYPLKISNQEFPVYRVVIDPGHGGIAQKPMSKHGDRYDSISKTYLDNYKDGAARRKIQENILVYEIAKKVERILKDIAPGGNNMRFYRLLKKYTDTEPKRIHIIAYMSRNKSIAEKKAKKMRDPNAEYRLFDYPDVNGTIQPGRLSKINAMKPHLLVSLHLAGNAPNEFQGINPVIAAPYDILFFGLQYLKGEKKGRKFFDGSPYSNWFDESTKRSDFDWFLNDVSLYFTSYPLKKDRSIDLSNFKGYRYNMVTWAYSDSILWELLARRHMKGTRYADSYLNIIPEGRFWSREKSIYERYRRKKGPEGFGGDNAYASYEIARYILYSLYLNGHHHRRQVAGKSYFSVWIVPLHVNAVNAFVELGYLNRKRDRYLLTKRQKEIAEGIAVGIYSLLAGLHPKTKNLKYLPKGKKIDLEKYQITSDTSYFDIVADD